MDISIRRSAASLLAAGVFAGGGLLGLAGGASATPREAPAAAQSPRGDWNWNWNWNTGSAPLPDAQPPTSGWSPQDWAQGVVVSDSRLYVRQRPSTHSPITGALRPGDTGPVYCAVKGELVNGNPWWLWIGEGWASSEYIDATRDVDDCSIS
ncbi:hypothetical protein ACFQLX_18080 [Streptomyces polyrhachis]|uniref:SH3 domain-containing protein n=1 Tax=Streptomyces polyrhachis TaxID=1282885 RepID=A0ABW2GH00_9ACTN